MTLAPVRHCEHGYDPEVMRHGHVDFNLRRSIHREFLSHNTHQLLPVLEPARVWPLRSRLPALCTTCPSAGWIRSTSTADLFVYHADSALPLAPHKPLPSLAVCGITCIGVGSPSACKREEGRDREGEGGRDAGWEGGRRDGGRQRGREAERQSRKHQKEVRTAIGGEERRASERSTDPLLTSLPPTRPPIHH